MGSIVPLHKSRTQDLKGLIDEMREKYPNAKRGVILVFDANDELGVDGGYFCNDSEIALASVLLAKIASNWNQ